MSEATPEQKQARMKEFMSLLPVSVELAGLQLCHPDRAFTPEQMEARATSLRIAYKIARQMIKDIGENGV